MKRNVLYQCGITILFFGFSIPNMASEFDSPIPWKYKVMEPSIYGEWSDAEIYLSDVDGNGTVDIIRNSPVSNDEALAVFISHSMSERLADHRYYAKPGDDSSYYRSDEVEFSKATFSDGINIWSFNSEHTKLIFVDNRPYPNHKYFPIIRQETTKEWAKDEFDSGEIYTFKYDASSINLSQHGRLDLGDEYNGLSNVTLESGDFNGDGLVDILLRELEPDNDSPQRNVRIAYGEINGNRLEVGASIDIYHSEDSQGSGDAPGLLLNNDESRIRVGDFNGDGYSDILRWNIDEVIENIDSDIKMDIWFGGENLGEFTRSYMYVDADGDYIRTSSDGEEITEEFYDYELNKVRIGDFNGDRSDDILLLSDDGKSYRVYLSHAVRTDIDQAQNVTVIHQKDALFSQNDFESELVYLNSPDLLTVDDFNNDGREDIGFWNGVPYILYSTNSAYGGDNFDGSSEGEIQFVGGTHRKTIDSSGRIGSHFSGHRSTYKQLKSADFNSDGIADFLMIPDTDDHKAVVYLTPPYNPVSTYKQKSFNNVTQVEGVSVGGRNFVFFNHGEELKYIFKDAYGWNSAKPLPLEDDNFASRCSGQDVPENYTFIDDISFPLSTTNNAKYLKPYCNVAFEPSKGDIFDVTVNGNYVYLFRSSGQNADLKVLVERFEFSEIDGKLIRLLESRYQATDMRYNKGLQEETISSSDARQTFGSSENIATQDVWGNQYFEPAFLVPAAVHGTGSGECGKLSGLTVSVSSSDIDNRFMLATASSIECGKPALLTSFLVGDDQIFATSNIEYEDGNENPIEMEWVYFREVDDVDGTLDSTIINTTLASSNGEESMFFDQELLIYHKERELNRSNAAGLLFYPINSLGDFHPSTSTRLPFWGSVRNEGTENPSPFNYAGRFYTGYDGLVRILQRNTSGNELFPEHVKFLTEQVIDPALFEHNDGDWLCIDYGHYENSSVRNMSFENSWPFIYLSYPVFTVEDLMLDPARHRKPAWTPKFGSYFNGGDDTLSQISPAVFTGTRLIEVNGTQVGLAIQEYVELIKLSDGSFQFAIAEVPLFELDTKKERVALSRDPIGYTEGAPPVPRENLGRSQQGNTFPYTYDLSNVILTIESGTTYTTNATNTGGATVVASATLGIPFIQTSTTVATDLKSGATDAKDEVYTLSSTIERGSFITGSIPSSPCTDDENGYLDPCYETDSEGNKSLELWAPHSEGTLFLSTIYADLYSYYDPKSRKLVGQSIGLDASEATEETMKIRINPEYLVAGSLDGYIGNQPLRRGGSSYFNPSEESTWRNEYARQKEELDARSQSARTTSENISSSEYVNDKLLVVYNAVTDGGFSNIPSEVASSVTDFYGYEIEFNLDTDLTFEDEISGSGFKAGAGAYYTRNFQQGSENSHSITFDAQIDRSVTSEVQDEHNNSLPNTVESYTSRSYFLPAKISNFETLFDKVIDPDWLNGVGDYGNVSSNELRNISDLKKMQASPVPLWRVTHRVDGVSRVMANPE